MNYKFNDLLKYLGTLDHKLSREERAKILSEVLKAVSRTHVEAPLPKRYIFIAVMSVFVSLNLGAFLFLVMKNSDGGNNWLTGIHILTALINGLSIGIVIATPKA